MNVLCFINVIYVLLDAAYCSGVVPQEKDWCPLPPPSLLPLAVKVPGGGEPASVVREPHCGIRESAPPVRCLFWLFYNFAPNGVYIRIRVLIHDSSKSISAIMPSERKACHGNWGKLIWGGSVFCVRFLWKWNWDRFLVNPKKPQPKILLELMSTSLLN